MSKVHSNQITVRVWRNIKTLGNLPSSHFGHASLTLSGLFVPATVGDPRHRVQISFWPGQGAGIGLSGLRRQSGVYSEQAVYDKASEMQQMTALRLEVGYRRAHSIPYPPRWDQMLAEHGKGPINDPRSGQSRLGFTTEGTQNDDETDEGMPMWSQSPEVKIALPGFLCKPRLWGLSITRMHKWWTAFRLQAPHYQALSRVQNCAGVVLMALKEGGAQAFVDLPPVRVYAEPTQVEQYARLLELQLDRYEDWSNALNAEVCDALNRSLITPPMLSGAVDGLWTLERWRSLSALGPLQPRSGTIRAIDDALAQYHASNWAEGYAQKWKAFSTIFQNIVLHRQQKTGSERGAAVLGLGLQVLATLRAPGAYL